MVDLPRIAAKIVKAERSPIWIRGAEEWAAVRAIVGEWLQSKVMTDGDSLMGFLSSGDASDGELPHEARVILLKIADELPTRFGDGRFLPFLMKRNLVGPPLDEADGYALTEDGRAVVAALRQQARDNPAGDRVASAAAAAEAASKSAAEEVARRLSPAQMNALESLLLKKTTNPGAVVVIARLVALALARKGLCFVSETETSLTPSGELVAAAVMELRRP